MFFKYLNGGFDRRHLVLSSLWFHSEFLQFTSFGVSLICGDLFDRELINFGLKINPFGIWVHWKKKLFEKIRVSKIYFSGIGIIIIYNDFANDISYSPYHIGSEILRDWFFSQFFESKISVKNSDQSYTTSCQRLFNKLFALKNQPWGTLKNWKFQNPTTGKLNTLLK